MKPIAYKQMFQNEESHAWYIGTRELMVESIKKYIKKDAKILDVGCGTGGTIKFLNKNGYKNTYGIDTSKLAIGYCQKRNLKNTKVGDVNRINFKSGTFDMVICLDVLYHQGVDLKRALKEIRRVLKNNGHFYSQEPAYEFLYSKHDIAIETKQRFNKKKLVSTFSKSGLNKIHLTYFNTFLLAPIALARFLNKHKINGKYDTDVKKLPVFLNAAMLFLLRAEIKTVRYIRFPAGLSIVSVWKK